MKKKAKKIKKVKLSLNKMSKKEKDYVAVLLEEVRSNFMVFGETLGGFGDKLELVKQKGDATFEEVGRIKVEMAEMNIRLDRIEREVSLIRSEIERIKNILTKKVDLDYIKKLEVRLVKVEKHLKLSVR